MIKSVRIGYTCTSVTCINTCNLSLLCRILSQLPAANSPCQSRTDLPVHIIYTDIVGLRQFKRYVKGGYGKFRSVSKFIFLCIYMMVIPPYLNLHGAGKSSGSRSVKWSCVVCLHVKMVSIDLRVNLTWYFTFPG